MSADDLATVADYIFNGDPNDELGKARAEAAYTANHLGIVLDELAASQAENARLREALKFYADVRKYPSPLTGGMGDLWADCGEIARAALTQGPVT